MVNGKLKFLQFYVINKSWKVVEEKEPKMKNFLKGKVTIIQNLSKNYFNKIIFRKFTKQKLEIGLLITSH